MAKRGRNEGSIYKRKDGRWDAALNLGFQGGRLKRKTFYGKTRSDVAEKLTNAIADMKKGLPVVTAMTGPDGAHFLSRTHTG